MTHGKAVYYDRYFTLKLLTTEEDNMSMKLELYGTLGPSDCDKATLKEMFHYGMTGLRLNLSHRSLAECKDWLDQVYEASEELHIVPDLLVDLMGPELRIGELETPLVLESGQIIALKPVGSSADSSENSAAGSPAMFSNNHPPIPFPPVVYPHLKKGGQFLLDDGKILLEILDENGQTAKVVRGGTLLSRKSIALPGQDISLPTLTEKDMENLRVLAKYRVTGVMLPFVRNAGDLIALKKELVSLGLAHVRIFAKIENQAGIDALPSLLPHCDQIVIARGDLANAVSMTKLPAIQKKIARLCRRTKTPFMVVTQMLASMENAPVPTRAEVSDIFNAVLDGASSLMLTGETAIGAYPVQAIKVLSDVSFEALRYRMEERFALPQF